MKRRHTLTTADEAIEFAIRTAALQWLEELEAAADTLAECARTADLNADDRYQISAALGGLSSRIITHPQREKLTPGREKGKHLTF